MPTWVVWVLRLAAVLAGLWLAWLLGNVLLLLAIALLLTVTFLPVVRWLESRGVPHLPSVIACFVVLLGLLGSLMAYVIPVVAGQGQQLTLTLPAVTEQLAGIQERWTLLRGQYPFLPRFAEMYGWGAARSAEWLQQTIGFTGRLVMLSVEAFTVLFLAFFFLKDGQTLLDQVARGLPARSGGDTRELLERIASRVGRYVLGRVLVMLAVGILTAMGLAVIGMPYAILLGVLAGLLDVIPYAGPWLAAAPGILLALSMPWPAIVWVGVVYLVVQQVESYVLSPLIVGRTVGLHPAWILIALLVGADLMGIIGMVLAIPAAVTLLVLLEELYLPRVRPGEDRPAPSAPPEG